MAAEKSAAAQAPRSLTAAYLTVALLAFAIALMAWEARGRVPLLERLDHLSLDAQTQWRGRLPPATEHPLVLVALDDASLQRLGTFAPDRRLMAQAIDQLTAAEAKVIALDILMLEPARPDPASDAVLAQAMRASGRVLIPFVLPGEAGSTNAPASSALLASAITQYSGEVAQRHVGLRPVRLVAPLDSLTAAAAGVGHVSEPRGADGSLRYDLPALTFDGEVYPSMALRIAALAGGVAWPSVNVQFGRELLLGTHRVPLDSFSRQWVNYYGPAGTIRTVSFVDVLDGKLAPGSLRGAVVIVGASALGAGDHFPSPFDAALPGAERVATVVDNILSDRVLSRPAWGTAAEVVAMLALPLLAVGLIGARRMRSTVLSLALLAAVAIALALGLQSLFVQHHQFLSPAFPLAALLLATLGATAVRSAAEQAKKRAALVALQASEERYALAQQGANDGLWDWDIAAGKVYFSERWLSLMNADTRLPPTMAAWTAPLDAAAAQAFETALAEHLAGHSQQFHHLLNFSQGGAERWLLARAVATRMADKNGLSQATRMAGSLTDVTEQQQLQRQITFDAIHDRLTGLPNRMLFLERLGQRFRSEISNGLKREVGVVLVDIDGFRALNEQEGTPAADAVLIELARRLATRDGAPLDLARLGGDRFALQFSAPLLPGGSDEAQLAAWARAQFDAPFQIGMQPGVLTASVGWAHASHGPVNADELLAAAEMALAHAKAHARGQVHVYDPAEQLLENSRRWLKDNLDNALSQQQFRLFYQPLMRLSDRSLLGFEALIRWPHPTKGLVMPGDFIPFAEESGQIVAMGRWIMLEAARQLVAWDALGFTGEIAVNLSGAQFSQGDLATDARDVLALLGAAHINPRRIKLEVTESMAMANPQVTALALQHLVALGFKISIDDFGTGYSSLAYLHRFPFDTLKIDRSFVIRLASGREAVEIVRTIVGLALALGKQVLAEGVEEELQAQLLQELGVHVGQGWLFNKALSVEAAEALIVAAAPNPV